MATALEREGGPAVQIHKKDSELSLETLRQLSGLIVLTRDVPDEDFLDAAHRREDSSESERARD